ncbi:putative lysine-2,3-aminomutase-like protein [Leptospira weilii serovar Ranarum str. ICFT]|uniref:Lysine-2,3-aminomutase-like protein n=1 Tax=Leptospira weilii serovar Ranarum str. ICFT TaxID=1218598 RepID=N1WSB5_9LEPT|nr:KamA family radical SAM protein [Leptospira weilii]EMY78738.1 putative lysine-2,3-aminomutase-like protein [Leptospira weilii serovar Ranarum str. ICFT]
MPHSRFDHTRFPNDLESSPKWSNWKWQIQNRIKTQAQLSEQLELTEEEKLSFDACSTFFEFSVTPYYLNLADKKNPNCPIRLQIIPRREELVRNDFEREDPLAEETHMPVKGVTHRYPDRAIWYLSHVCAVYCRFCTRKRKVSKSSHTPGKEEWDQALVYFRSHPEIKEVILSGGDPLNLSDEKLDYLLRELKSIPHINQVRIHSRYPVTLPMRIDSSLCAVLKKHFPIYLVTHFNHPKEITPLVRERISFLIRKGNAMVLNQSVLLKGINDSAETLKELFYGLTAIGIKPYYLHQCDEVWGSGGFRVEMERGMEIMKQIRGKISGLSVPLYVVDLTGGGGKVPLPTSYLAEKTDHSYIFRNYQDELYEIGY